MEAKKFEDWIKDKPKLNLSVTVLKTQEERCEFCKKYIIPAIIDMLTRPFTEDELNRLDEISDIEWEWEVINNREMV